MKGEEVKERAVWTPHSRSVQILALCEPYSRSAPYITPAMYDPSHSLPIEKRNPQSPQPKNYRPIPVWINGHVRPIPKGSKQRPIAYLPPSSYIEVRLPRERERETETRDGSIRDSSIPHLHPPSVK